MVELEVLSVVETSKLASEASGALQDGEHDAKPHLTTNLPFRLALDVRRARISRIQPLLHTTPPSAEPEKTALEATEPATREPAAAAPTRFSPAQRLAGL